MAVSALTNGGALRRRAQAAFDFCGVERSGRRRVVTKSFPSRELWSSC